MYLCSSRSPGEASSGTMWMMSWWLKKKERKRNQKKKKKRLSVSLCWMFRENCKYIDFFTWPEILLIKLKPEWYPQMGSWIQTTGYLQTHTHTHTPHNKAKQTGSESKGGRCLPSSPSTPTKPPHLDFIVRWSEVNTELRTENSTCSGSATCHVAWMSPLISLPSPYIAWWNTTYLLPGKSWS